MSDDQALKMYETRAELDDIREEMIQIRNQNNEMRNQLVVNELIQNVNYFQTNISTRVQTIQENVNTLSTRVLNHDQILSEINESLRKINENLNKQSETLDKQSQTLNKQTEILNRQNETIQILKANVGNQIFMSPIGCSETETILLLGGEDGNNELDTLLILENNRNKWKQLNVKLPHAVQTHGAQFINNNLYIFGGWKNKEGAINSTYKLSKSLQWEKMADMNQKRYGISNSSVILNNQIWVCGGYNEEENNLKSVEMCDPVTNKWKYVKEMNESRSHTAAAVVNGKIFCAGGYLFSSVECYDPSSDVWTLVCNMPHSIRGHGAVEIDGNLIVIGGYDSNSRKGLNNVWALDTTDKNAEWIEKPSMSIPRRHFSIAKIDDKVFVCGGATKEDEKLKTIDSVEIFDGEVCRNGPNMPTGRYKAPAVVIPMKFGIDLLIE